jgi:hypothetical protein
MASWFGKVIESGKDLPTGNRAEFGKVIGSGKDLPTGNRAEGLALKSRR